MNSKIKSIILNHLNSNEKAMLKIVNENSITNITLKLPYTVLKNDNKYLLLIKNNDNIYKKQILQNANSTYQLNSMLDLDKKISILIVNQAENEQTPVFWGGTNCVNSSDCENEVQENLINDVNTNIDNYSNKFLSNEKNQKDNSQAKNSETFINKNANNFDKENYLSNENIKNFEINKNNDNNKQNEEPFAEEQNNNDINEFNSNQKENAPQFNIIEGKKSAFAPELFDYTEQEVEDEIDYFMSAPEIIENDNNACASCKYKEEFYDQERLKEARQTLYEIEKMQNENKETETPQYFSLIQGQYNEMFNRYPQCEELKNVLPNSKWVRVDIENESYVLGLIYNNNQVQYMCYGVPQNHKENAPPELQDISQWLPIDALNPNGSGYWIMYQSAETGETIKVDVV